MVGRNKATFNRDADNTTTLVSPPGQQNGFGTGADEFPVSPAESNKQMQTGQWASCHCSAAFLVSQGRSRRRDIKRGIRCSQSRKIGRIQSHNCA